MNLFKAINVNKRIVVLKKVSISKYFSIVQPIAKTDKKNEILFLVTKFKKLYIAPNKSRQKVKKFVVFSGE
ncbi:MAG: hypothetical protein N2558_03315 [Patescibacteria group bacterium]|nr:hypothetical protein [Patescibacteria group bacterium]